MINIIWQIWFQLFILMAKYSINDSLRISYASYNSYIISRVNSVRNPIFEQNFLAQVFSISDGFTICKVLYVRIFMCKKWTKIKRFKRILLAFENLLCHGIHSIYNTYQITDELTLDLEGRQKLLKAESRKSMHTSQW